MDPKLPVLEILPVQSLVIHENHDDSRAGPLIERIQGCDIFTNPIIVTPFHDHSARYMVLDGANRTTAVRKIGFPHILAQVVEEDTLNAETRTWNHVIWDMDSIELLEDIRSIPGLELHPTDVVHSHESTNKKALITLQLPNWDTYTGHIQTVNILERNETLNAVVSKYKDKANHDRTNQNSVKLLRKLYPTLSGLVIMPNLEIGHILYLAGEGYKLPSGVTRFMVSPRALRVNYPLAELASHKSLGQKNDTLHAWIQDQVARKGVRYYSESTVLYDE